MQKLIEMNNNVYKVIMLPTGGLRFYVRVAYSWRILHTAPIIARITAAMVEADHIEALIMEDNRATAALCNKVGRINNDRVTTGGVLMVKHSVYDVVLACHIEALQENYRFDWLRNRFGIFYASPEAVRGSMIEQAHREALRIADSSAYRSCRGDQLVAGQTVRTPDGDLVISNIEQVTDNELRISWQSGHIRRSLYPHTIVEVRV